MTDNVQANPDAQPGVQTPVWQRDPASGDQSISGWTTDQGDQPVPPWPRTVP